MTSAQIRQSFLDFFKSKQHTIVPSSSLMPDSPNLLFTNAGMNQFVPIFLGQTQCPYTPGRAADTQKCIRAGGKHNDLDDVGLDTYHHTFFEMLGNWSFGDYFKKEAIEWAWELVVTVWKFPPQRLYATVYSPDKSKNDPSDFDQEAWNFWADKFRSVGLDPAVHIVNGNKKDNFWMMGETGPCGPCSELHVDLTPAGDTKGSLVNKGDARCIEIWNLVFMQFNANPDGTFSPLPAKAVDTGMGFERVTSIMQGTRGLKDFAHARISNYETDIFRPIFDALEKMSGKRYGSTLPGSAGAPPAGSGESDAETRRRGAGAPSAEQLAIDVAFRVIGDHIRTLSFAIADGIQPGNTDRNYVLRRILRRAVRYGRTLGFHEPFFYRLVDVLAETMGDIFPEIRARKKQVQETIRAEEDAFNKTLDNGIEIFECSSQELDVVNKFLSEVPQILSTIQNGLRSIPDAFPVSTKELEADWASFIVDIEGKLPKIYAESLSNLAKGGAKPVGIIRGWSERIQKLCQPATDSFRVLQNTKNMPGSFEKARADILNELEQLRQRTKEMLAETRVFPGDLAFKLYDTYGFPLDLTELMARERGLTVDVAGFNKLMDEQRERARKAQKKTVIELSQFDTNAPTKFLGFDYLETEAVVEAVVPGKKPNEFNVVFDRTACYAEMGGQVGDTGIVRVPGHDRSEVGRLQVLDTVKQGAVYIHRAVLAEGRAPEAGEAVRVAVDASRRNAIQRHHTVTHLLHWALHEVASKEASQKGSFVGPDKLTFDFNSQPLTPQQVADIEKLVNERILENAVVSWTEVPYAEVKSRKDVMQFFGDKYGDTVRVVQIGGAAHKLDGYSMELCGGTHTRATGEIGLFRIVGENAIAAGVRRIEAVAGLTAYDVMKLDRELIKTVAGKVNSPILELEKKIESLLEQQKALEKEVKLALLRNASNAASELLERIQTVNGIPLISHNLGDANGDFLQAIADALKGRFKGVVVLGGASAGAVALIATVSPDFTAKIQAGKIIQQIAPIVGGKGGGKPDNARGGGKDAGKLDEALVKAKSLLG